MKDSVIYILPEIKAVLERAHPKSSYMFSYKIGKVNNYKPTRYVLNYLKG